MKSPILYKIFLPVSFLLFWFGIILQFVLVFQNQQYNWIKSLDGFLMYFTVLTNIICGIALGVLLFFSGSRAINFLVKPGSLTALTVYIVIVGLVYNIVLRGIVNLTGWWVVANELLHVINPMVFLVFWIIYVDKSELKYKHVYPWLLYPFIYMVFALIRGVLMKTYPYPFLNVNELGYLNTAMNCLVLSFLFWLSSLFFVWLGQKINNRK